MFLSCIILIRVALMVIWVEMRRFTVPTCHSRSLLRCWATSWGSKQSRTWGNCPIPSAAFRKLREHLGRGRHRSIGWLVIMDDCRRYHLVSRGLLQAIIITMPACRDNGIFQSSNQCNGWGRGFSMAHLTWLNYFGVLDVLFGIVH